MANTRFVSGDFEITFYYMDYHDNPFPVGEAAWAQSSTECEIFCVSGEWSVNSFAYCSINDEYDVGLGEEIALERTIDQIKAFDGITKEEMDFIWDDYYRWVNAQ